jgi:hypothetical protein
LHVWHSPHVTHALPPAPHAVGRLPVLHPPPVSTQPEQHAPDAQWPAPPLQLVPFIVGIQVPMAEHWRHSPQLAHAAPAWPHAVVLVPG